MIDNDANPLKTAGNDAKPARIVLTNDEEIDATHHFRTDNAYVCVYEGARESGIDYRIPREQVRYIDTTGDTFDRVDDASDAPSTVTASAAGPPAIDEDTTNTDVLTLDAFKDSEDEEDERSEVANADDAAGDVVCYSGELFKITRPVCRHAEIIPTTDAAQRVCERKPGDGNHAMHVLGNRAMHVLLSEIDDVPEWVIR